MLSRMQRTFAKMDNDTHDIIARTSQASLPVKSSNSFLPKNENVNLTDQLN